MATLIGRVQCIQNKQDECCLTTLDISFTSDVDIPFRFNHVCMNRCVSICKLCVHQTLSEDSNLHFCHIYIQSDNKNSNFCTFMLHDNSIIYRLLADDVWIVSLKRNAVSSGWLVRIMAVYIFIFTVVNYDDGSSW